MRVDRSIRTRSTEYIARAVRHAYCLRHCLPRGQTQGAVPVFAATTLLKGFFDGVREFTKCWLQLMQTYPLVADRTVARYCAAIIVFARDALPLLTAHSAIGMSAVTDQSAKMELMQLKMDRMEIALAAQVAQQAPPSRKRPQQTTTYEEHRQQVEGAF